MILKHFLLAVNETNCYVLACEKSKVAVLIDPGEWDGQVAGYLKEQSLIVQYILLTHGHGDHTGGMEEAKALTGAKVAASRFLPVADLKLTEGDILSVGSMQIKVLETPGHTPDSLSFVIGGEIYCGDALFAGSVGGTSSRELHLQLLHSIKTKLFVLGDEMVIYPGHGPASTIRIERSFNPFLSA